MGDEDAYSAEVERDGEMEMQGGKEKVDPSRKGVGSSAEGEKEKGYG